MAGWFSKMISDGGWVGPALMAGATLYVGQQAAQANVRAAQIAANAAAQQAAAIQDGNRLAQQRFEQTNAQLEEQKAMAQPAVARMQQVAASDPHELDQGQQVEVEDSREQALRGLQVSGLRGSGRATVAVVRKTEQGVRDNMVAQNRARVDQANTALANQYFNTTGQQVQAAGQQAGIDQNSANAQAAAYGQAGQMQADSLLANTNLMGRAIGDVAAVTNDALKEGRRSYYRENKPTEGEEQV